MKKSYLVLATLFIIPLTSNSLNINDDIFDSFDSDAIDALLDSIDPASVASLQAPGCTADMVMTALNNFNIPKVLQQDFYCLTYPPVTRSVLDLPSLRIYQDPCRDWSAFILPFYNQTSKMALAGNSPFINNYLNFNADFLADLDIQTLLAGLNIEDIFPLIGIARLQERRVGGLLAAYKTHNKWSFGIRLPLYYLERNFFLNDAEREAIKNAPFFKFLSGGAASDDEEVTNLLIRHLAADKVGFGDTRISALYMIAGPQQELWVGGELTIPTAVAFRKGVFLSTFCKSKPPPPFSFFDLFQLTPLCGATPAEQTEGIAIVQDIGLEALDKLTANVADRPLGNNGHFSLSPTLEHHYHFTDCFQLITFASIEYLFAADEQRFFIICKNPAEFNRDFSDPNEASNNLAFLNQQAINTFFPTDVVCTRVTPGVIIKFSTGITYESYQAYGMLGYDFWWQAAEHLKINIARPLFNINKGTRPAAHQNKIFGYVGRKMYIYDYDIRLGFRSDLTLESRNIGKDFTVALDLNIDF